MKLFIVEKDSYEDRHVVGVYTTKERAEQAKDLFASDNPILEFECDALPDLKEFAQGLLPWEVYMNKVGGARNARCTFRVSVVGFKPEARPINKLEYSFRVFARSREHAIENADKTRAHLISEGKWKI